MSIEELLGSSRDHKTVHDFQRVLQLRDDIVIYQSPAIDKRAKDLHRATLDSVLNGFSDPLDRLAAMLICHQIPDVYDRACNDVMTEPDLELRARKAVLFRVLADRLGGKGKQVYGRQVLLTDKEKTGACFLLDHFITGPLSHQNTYQTARRDRVLPRAMMVREAMAKDHGIFVDNFGVSLSAIRYLGLHGTIKDVSAAVDFAVRWAGEKNYSGYLRHYTACARQHRGDPGMTNWRHHLDENRNGHVRNIGIELDYFQKLSLYRGGKIDEKSYQAAKADVVGNLRHSFRVISSKTTSCMMALEIMSAPDLKKEMPRLFNCVLADFKKTYECLNPEGEFYEGITLRANELLSEVDNAWSNRQLFRNASQIIHHLVSNYSDDSDHVSHFKAWKYAAHYAGLRYTVGRVAPYLGGVHDKVAKVAANEVLGNMRRKEEARSSFVPRPHSASRLG